MLSFPVIGAISVASALFTLYLAVGLLVALVIHEFAHAAVAVRMKDPTPRQTGRLTLNPRAHADPFGTFILPGIVLLPVLFGTSLFPIFAYAKPQPVNLWSGRRRIVAVAAAGPIANLVAAFVFGALFRLSPTGELSRLLGAFVGVNVTMAVLHLIPIPPLDASRVLATYLSGRAQEVYIGWDPLGALFILVIFFIIPGVIFAFVDAVGGGICQIVAGVRC